jgi:hypothetical protein
LALIELPTGSFLVLAQIELAAGAQHPPVEVDGIEKVGYFEDRVIS